MYLLINSCDNEMIYLALAQAGKLLKTKKIKAKYTHGEKLLPAIDKLLAEVGMEIKNLKAIGVAVGPGGFTAVRIGVATANALAYALKIPVVGDLWQEGETMTSFYERLASRLSVKHTNKVVTLAIPEYGREPNISMKK